MLYIFLKALAVGFFIAMPVGPIGAFCIKESITRGFFYGIAVGLGAALADSLYGFFATGSLTFISTMVFDHTNAAKIIGGSMLLLIGIKDIVKAHQINNNDIDVKESGFFGIIISVFFLTLTNPLTIFAFMAIFAAIGGLNASGISLLVIILGIFAGSLLWWLILSGTVSSLRHRVPISWMVRIKISSGIMLIMFAAFCFGDAIAH